MAAIGTCTVTYQKKILCRHMEWLDATKILYNQVLNYYYGLLKKYPEISLLSSQHAMRELEKLTIMGRDKLQPIEELPFKKIPLYFRRAAINASVAMMHSYQEKHKNWVMEEAPKGNEPMTAEIICASPVFYKGMYKELEENSIILKVYTGKTWCWMKCKLKGRKLPANARLLSPSVVTGKKNAMLHVPVKREVKDARTVKERMEENERICGVTFSNADTMAVCAVYDADGREISNRFIRGGNVYSHHSKRLVDKIKQNRKTMGKHFDWSGANKKYWKHRRNLREYYAHKVSREIVDFCFKNNVKVIAVTKSESVMPAYIQSRLGESSPYLLQKLIMEKLFYKAWQEGIVITGVRPHYTSAKCNICRTYLIKQEKDGAEYRCKGGHRGNRNLNTARNIAKMCLKKFGKHGKEESMQISFA